KVTKVDAGRWRRAVASEFVRAACYIGRIRVLCRRNLMFRSVAVAPKILRLPFVALLLPLLVSGCGVNNIPTFQEQAKARWSDVQNQYQRRADLIPNLVETVRGYARQEREVLEAVTNARARATSIQVTPEMLNDPEAFKKFQEAQAQLSTALGRLLAITENYPDLKSNQNFLALQAQLEGTENRIAVARRDYIEAVRGSDSVSRTRRGVTWAITLFRSHTPMDSVRSREETRRPPTVKFWPRHGAPRDASHTARPGGLAAGGLRRRRIGRGRADAHL